MIIKQNHIITIYSLIILLMGCACKQSSPPVEKDYSKIGNDTIIAIEKMFFSTEFSLFKNAFIREHNILIKTDLDLSKDSFIINDSTIAKLSKNRSSISLSFEELMPKLYLIKIENKEENALFTMIIEQSKSEFKILDSQSLEN